MSYIGQQLPADVFSGFVTDSFTGDGSATTFTLSKAPFSEDALIVVINNVIQKPVTNFTVSGTTLTIVGTAVASGDVIYAMHTSGAVPITLASKVDVNGLSDGVILDADADTTISADTDDQIDIKIAGADDFQFTANTFTVNSGSKLTFGDGGSISGLSATQFRKGGSAQSISANTVTVITNFDEVSITGQGEITPNATFNDSDNNFVFPVTGIYYVDIHILYSIANITSDYNAVYPFWTENNGSDYTQLGQGIVAHTATGAASYGTVTWQGLVDVTDISNDKLQIKYQSEGATSVLTSDTRSDSTVNIIRLGDT